MFALSYIVRKASEADALQIQHFMSKTGMRPAAPNTNWSTFLLAEDEAKQLVAIIQIQSISDRAALLRSLIIDTNKVTPFFLLEFLETTIHYTYNEGLQEIYLLAKSEHHFFQALGFKLVEQHYLPKELGEVTDVKTHLEKNQSVFMHSKKS